MGDEAWGVLLDASGLAIFRGMLILWRLSSMENLCGHCYFGSSFDYYHLGGIVLLF